jgi:hypothetical protein
LQIDNWRTAAGQGEKPALWDLRSAQAGWSPLDKTLPPVALNTARFCRDGRRFAVIVSSSWATRAARCAAALALPLVGLSPLRARAADDGFAVVKAAASAHWVVQPALVFVP